MLLGKEHNESTMDRLNELRAAVASFKCALMLMMMLFVLLMNCNTELL